MPSLGMAFALFTNQFYIGYFTLVDFEDLSKERNTSALDLEGSSILKTPRESQPRLFQATVENEVDNFGYQRWW